MLWVSVENKKITKLDVSARLSVGIFSEETVALLHSLFYRHFESSIKMPDNACRRCHGDVGQLSLCAETRHGG